MMDAVWLDNQAGGTSDIHRERERQKREIERERDTKKRERERERERLRPSNISLFSHQIKDEEGLEATT